MVVPYGSRRIGTDSALRSPKCFDSHWRRTTTTARLFPWQVGWLTSSLARPSESVCRPRQPLLVDATGLQETDADGLALLAKILAGGGRIEGLSRYLAMHVEALRERGGD